MEKFCSVALLLVGIAEPVFALTVRLDTSAIGTPPQIEYTAGSGSPAEFTLQLVNEEAFETPPIILWQLGLAIVEAGATTGQVKFSSVAAPADPLFGTFPGPGPPIVNPVGNVVVSDVDISNEGVVISADGTRNILQISLSMSANAEGLFALTMSGFDAAMPDQSSYWLPADEGALPLPFDNAPTQMGSEDIVLATLLVTQPSLFGDYNSNGTVDAADYTVWRDHFGQLIALDNENPDAMTLGEVDDEDYNFWKFHFGESTHHGTASHSAIPEPASLILLIVGALCRCLRRHWNMP